MAIRSSSFQAIGTHWEIQLFDNISNSTWLQILDSINERIQVFDQIYSRFRSDSLVTHLSKEAGSYTLPPDAYTMLRFYEQLYASTAGKVTPMIGQTMADAGYNATYSLRAGLVKAAPSWEQTLTYDKEHLELKRPALLDFGAAGKGYLVDIISDLLAKQELASYIINAGGDIMHRSATSAGLQVGLENPNDISEAIGIATIYNQSICASAGSKRKWGQFHHIIDPVTLSSPDEIIATWVIASDTMTADGLATALFFTDAEILAKDFMFSYALLDKSMGLVCSKDFPITFFNKA